MKLGILPEILAACAGSALIAVSTIGSIGSLRATAIEERESASLIPPQDLKHFVLGYNEIVADSLWLRVIQNIDRCGKGFERSSLEADSESFVKENPGDLPPAPLCDRGWVFRHLDTITEMTPKFRAAYIFGAPALSVLVNDREGARIIYDKAIQAYPDDWKITLGAAYHYLLEVKDEKKAADLLVQAGRLGAPKWVFALAGRLYTQVGQAVLAKIMLTEALRLVEDDPEGQAATRIRQRLAEAEKVLSEQGVGSEAQQESNQSHSNRRPRVSD